MSPTIAVECGETTIEVRMSRRDTIHTATLVQPYLRCGMTVLDIGCGSGHVGREVRKLGVRVFACDIRDLRAIRNGEFVICDAERLPFPDRCFDAVMMNFVLHHVSDTAKVRVLHEAMRVTRRLAVILEDTPASFLDRFFSRRHGEAFRRRAGIDTPFGFLTDNEWQWLFRGLGVDVTVRKRLGRFSRSLIQPFRRTLFVIEK